MAQEEQNLSVPHDHEATFIAPVVACLIVHVADQGSIFLMRKKMIMTKKEVKMKEFSMLGLGTLS